jgi:H+-transporting ATPase
VLWMAVLGTQILATLIAVYGIFMTPLGWKWAGFVWGYALLWAFVNDRIKLLAYRIFDPTNASSISKDAVPATGKPQAKDKPDTKADLKPNAATAATPVAKAQPKPVAKAEATPDVKAEADGSAKAKTSPDLTPQISKRAYELYEKHGHQSDHAAQDWEQAKMEIQKGESNTEPGPQPNAKSQAKPKATTGLAPQIVERVHELYEELGRNDVRAVEEMEKKQEAT